MLSATGEVSSLVHAENLLNVIEALDDAELAALLAHLLDTHDINAPAWPAATNAMPRTGNIEIIAMKPSRMVELSGDECSHQWNVRHHFRQNCLT